MTSVEIIVWALLAAGLFASFSIARASRGNGSTKFVGALFVALLLGIVLTLAASLSLGLCEDILKVCKPVAMDAGYDIFYLFVATPLYLLVMLFTSPADRN